MKKLFTLLFIAVSITVNAQTPFAYYPLNGNGNDASGNNKNGNAQFTIPVPDRNNNSDAALRFVNGNGSTCEVADTTNFGNGNGSVSLAVWFKNDGNGINAIFTSGMQGFATGIFFCVNYVFYDGSICFALAGENGALSTSNMIFLCSKENTYKDDVWHHAAVVVDKSSDIVTMYIDGKKAKIQNFSGFGQTGKGTLQADSTELNIAGLKNNSSPSQSYIGVGTSSGLTQNWSGTLDELYYFKSALSPAQVQDLYNGISIGMEATVKKNTFELFPNPSKGILHLKNNSGKLNQVQVLDMQGRVLKTFETQGLYTNVDVQDFQNGIYVLKFDSGETTKFILNQ